MMKRQFATITRRLAATVFSAMLAFSSMQVAYAEDNTGTGDVGGDAAALVDSNIFQLFSTGAALTLVKTAFLNVGGSALTTGATLPQGTLVDFMIYVNNNGSVPMTDVSVQDILGPLFAYQVGTIRVDNSQANCAVTVCTPAEEGTIYAAAAAAAASTDAIDTDTASFGGTTVDVGNAAVANAQLDVAANTVMAVVFTVQVQ
ncbi:MAG: hypothetical protein BMS9Abin32_399 [Gammaproteobacteria bacterium]|nr:MAG: hypothetical protein BMS9Abin32_399 [Gammaproteobacteria bacterium]